MSKTENVLAQAINPIGDGGYTFIVIDGVKRNGFLHCNVLNKAGFQSMQLKAGMDMVIDYELGEKGPRVTKISMLDGIESGSPVKREYSGSDTKAA